MNIDGVIEAKVAEDQSEEWGLYLIPKDEEICLTEDDLKEALSLIQISRGNDTTEKLAPGARTNAHEIDVTPITTLEKLAAEEKFVSVPLNLPVDWVATDWIFKNNGVEMSNSYLTEVYAPGDENGWAVVYVDDAEGGHTGETMLIRGIWTIERVRACPIDGSELSEAPVG